MSKEKEMKQKSFLKKSLQVTIMKKTQEDVD